MQDVLQSRTRASSWDLTRSREISRTELAERTRVQGVSTIGEPLPARFKSMNDDDIMDLAKTVKARAQEVDFEMKKRELHYLDWEWGRR